MNKISSKIVDTLIQSKPAAPAVTMYVPTHKSASPPHMSEDQTRFKNLFHRALEILDNRDKHNKFNAEFKKRCEALLEDRNFWEERTQSLLICARPEMFEHYHLPIDSDEYVAVDDHFHLTPVLGLIHDLQEYYVLSVTQKNPALWKGDLYDLYPTDASLPETLEAALNLDEPNARTEHAESAVGSSMNTGVYNGRGGARDPREEDRFRFFRMIDQIVYHQTDRSLPLILAGIESDVAEYRKESKYPNLAKSCIHVNFGADDRPALHQKAMSVIREEIIGPAHHQALERFLRLSGQSPEKTAEQIAAVKKAAEGGRVDTLLVGMSRETRDTVRDNDTAVTKLVFPSEEQSQAVDYIARQVFNQSGSIINLDQEEMPHHNLLLAINRY
jgi:hypothetical protein